MNRPQVTNSRSYKFYRKFHAFQNTPPLYFFCILTMAVIPAMSPQNKTASAIVITGSPNKARSPLSAMATAMIPIALPKALP